MDTVNSNEGAGSRDGVDVLYGTSGRADAALHDAMARLRMVASVVRAHRMSRAEAEADLNAADVLPRLAPEAQYVLDRLPLSAAERPDFTPGEVRDLAGLQAGWIGGVRQPPESSAT